MAYNVFISYSSKNLNIVDWARSTLSQSAGQSTRSGFGGDPGCGHSVIISFAGLNYNEVRARVAKSADATDLKSINRLLRGLLPIAK